MNNEELETEISLDELFTLLGRKWKAIVLATVGVALAALIITITLIPKQYTSRISMYVNNSKATSSDSIELNDINASKSLVNTYIALLQSDSVLDKVVKEIDREEYDLEKVQKIISCASVNNTEIFEVNVTTTDAQLSADIANYIAEIAPKEIIRVFKAGSVEVVDTAKVATSPSSPNVILNTIIGALLGMVGSIGIILIMSMIDQRIKEPKDFESHYNVPLLGIIPDRIKK